MTDKEKQLADIIFSIPIDRWIKGEKVNTIFRTESRGKTIILHPSHGQNKGWFSIDGVEIYPEGVNELAGKIERKIILNESSLRDNKLDEILTYFSKFND